MSDDYENTLSRLTGVWSLVKSEFRTDSGDTLYPLGEDAVGQAIFTADGFMSGQLMRRNRSRFEQDSQLLGTEAEIQEAFQGYIAYFGHCEIDAERRTITTRVDGSLFPNWVGGEQLRYFEFEDEQLVLTTPPIAIGDDHITGVLTWSRSEQGGAGTSAV